MSVEQLITDNIDIWTSAIKTKSASGRGSSNKLELYGIKKLRELIFELAVRGKLVAQDPSDEPASKLIDRIAAEKEQFVKEKLIRKPKSLPAVTSEEHPFDVPQNWQLVRLNEIGDWGSGSTPKRSFSDYYGGGIPWFKSGELVSDFISESEETITELALKETSLRLNKVGDVLIAMYGATIGKTSILAVQGTTNQAVCACTPFSRINNRYLLLVLKAFKSRFINMGAGGAQPNISREKIIATVIPLAPELEQKRIVAKVDELMALCDQLESQTEASIEAHQLLVKTLLETLANAKDADELNDSWQRISEHFDVLFTTEDSIDQLKQTILQLAVMGKLVKQDPGDEPASKLLERIAAEKEQLIKDKIIKKQKPLPPIADEEKPFDLHESWSFERLGSIMAKITDGTHHSPPNGEKGDYLYITAKNIKEGGIQLSNATFVTAEVHEEIYSRCNPEEGDILYIKDGATTGITTINDISEPFSMLSSVALLKPTCGVLNTYLLYTLRSPLFYNEMRAGMSGVAITRVTLKKLDNAFIPLPPIDEQKRIVAKVDELMALCNTLKARLNDARTTQLHLTDAIVEQAS